MKRLGLMVMLLSVVWVSCDSNRVFEEDTAIPDGVWNVANQVTFNVAISDTVTPHNFYLNIRNTKSYPYSNLFVFVHIEFPNGKSSRDTVECILADQFGRWEGSDSGSIIDNQIMIKYNKIFPLKGTYKVAIEQAMREEELMEVIDIGLRVEKNQ